LARRWDAVRPVPGAAGAAALLWCLLRKPFEKALILLKKLFGKRKKTLSNLAGMV
jgi:hypothetical protein